jgi:parallel beta-helix repeat protein
VDLLFSSNNTIIENDIEANKDVGIYFWNSSDNSFYHNNFVNNTHQIYDGHWDHPEQCLPSINFWDNDFPSGGNYWSDYNGTDLNTDLDQNATGSDGIGDTPYTIDENNTDKYPLMRLWTSPDIAVLNVTPSKLTTRQGFLIHINITVMNQGNKIEGSNLAAYANSTAIQTEYFTLVSSNSAMFTFTWNTTSFPKGNYTISAYVSPVEGETDTDDNSYIDGTVQIDIPPHIVILSPQNETYYSESIPLTFEIDEITSWISYSLDNQLNVTVSGNTTITVERGPHQIRVYANDTSGNMGTSEIVYFAVEIHDIAVTTISLSKTLVGPGYPVKISVTIQNQGDLAETCNIAAYANTQEVETRKITLTTGSSTTITFTWNTFGFAKGNYTIWAYASPLLYEIDLSDNNKTAIYQVKVGVPGDLNNDGKCNISDLIKVAGKFGAEKGDPHSPPEKKYDPNYDMNDDDKINISDLIKVARHFGAT